MIDAVLVIRVWKTTPWLQLRYRRLGDWLADAEQSDSHAPWIIRARWGHA